MRRMLVGMVSAMVVGGGVGATRGCTTRAEAPFVRDVWVDATGKEVASAGALWHLDEAGRVYFLEPETGQPATLYDNLAMHAGFERGDCQGPLLVGQPVPPRVPFSLGDGMGYRVRGDGAGLERVLFRSRMLASGACEEYLIPQVREAFEAPPPTLPGLPVLPYLGPLHVERRP